MKIELTEKDDRMKQNLISQIKKINRETNERSYKTRERYYDATERFCGYLAMNFHLQKFQNVREKHLHDYTKYLKETNISTKTIKTELSAIRFFHDHSGSHNILPDNNKLNLDKVESSKIDRAWTIEEIKEGIALAKIMGRADVAASLNLGYQFGMRLEETCRCNVSYLKSAIDNEELYVKGKGGQIRYVPVKNEKQMDLLHGLLKYAQMQKKTGGEKIFVDSVKGGTEAKKKSIEGWIQRNRDKFTDTSKRMELNNEEARIPPIIVKSSPSSKNGIAIKSSGAPNNLKVLI